MVWLEVVLQNGGSVGRSKYLGMGNHSKGFREAQSCWDLLTGDELQVIS